MLKMCVKISLHVIKNTTQSPTITSHQYSESVYSTSILLSSHFKVWEGGKFQEVKKKTI